MLSYLATRLVRWIAGLSIVLFVAYAMMFFGIGDPVRRIYMDQSDSRLWVTDQMLDNLREKYGMNKPFLEQFRDYVSKLLQGDMGNTLASPNRPVGEIVAARLPISVQIGLASTLMISIFGIGLGIIAALNHNRWLDSLIVGGVAFFNAIPSFVTAPMLMLFFVLGLKIMDVPYGWKGLFNQQVILPIVVITLGGIQGIIRMTRAGILEVMDSDYIRMARAKGLPERLVIIRHVLRPVLIPVVTSIGLTMISLVNGAIYVERIFNIPGFGFLTTDAVTSGDYPVIMAVVLVGTLIVMISNLLVDLVYPFLDPRITHE